MLSQKENEFIVYWQSNRLKEKNNPKYLFIGISFGLLSCLVIFLFISSGWYERATMEAYSKFSSLLFAFIIIIISGTFGFLYRMYKWEQFEQQYHELLAKKGKK